MKESIVTTNSRHSIFWNEVLTYVEQGYFLIPLHKIEEDGNCSCLVHECSSAGKHPMTRNGVKDASNNSETINLWWVNNSPNIGIVTGLKSNLVVLDIDVKNGGLDSLAKLESTHGSLQNFASVKSGGGGKHFYFRAPENQVGNKVGILPGIDFRGENGYIVAPPSNHKSGKSYEWVVNKELEPMPSWLLSLVQQKPQLVLCSQDKDVFEGQRNNFLTSVAGFLKSRGLGVKGLEAALVSLNQSICAPALPMQEVQTILKSMEKYQSWDPIKPIPESNIQLTPLQENHLPSLLKPWIIDVCERMQLPLEFIAAPAIIAVSSMIGRKISIQPLKNDDWSVIPNLWGMLVADPGAMKSSAVSQAMAPINALEKKARKDFEKLAQERAQQEKNMAIEIESLRSSLKLDWSQGLGADIAIKKEHLKSLNEKQQDRLKEKRHKTNDPTIEKLALIMQDNPQGVLLLRDELSGWLESLSKNGREGSREFYLEAWNGNGSFSIDRVGRGSTFAESICLSVFGGIQPQKLQKYMDRYDADHGQDGFLDRFQLAVFPERKNTWKLIDRKPDKAAFDRVMTFFEFLDDITFEDQRIITICYSSEAQSISDEWRCCLENRICDPDMSDIKKSYLSKYRSLMPSLALIFEVLQKQCIPMAVGQESTKLAVQWCEVLESHMNKILNMGMSQESAAKKFLDKIKSGEIYSGQSTRDIYRKQWQGLNTPEKVNQTISILTECGYLKTLKEASGLGGRSSETILINPAFGGVK